MKKEQKTKPTLDVPKEETIVLVVGAALSYVVGRKIGRFKTLRQVKKLNH